ncbi:MAG TPA: Ig-like domain-containing protein [Gemmatimonadales bacterium]|nr:Ig-like domain-containing protein [Gemmatimonadales bacterium]
MSRHREPPPLIPPALLRAGDPIGRRQFVRTAGGIFVAASGFACTDKLPGALQVLAPDPDLCTVTVSAAAIAAGGTATLTLQAKGTSGADLTSGGASVVFTASGGTSAGTISATVDHGDGTYTAVYTGTAAGTAQSIGATVNGAAVTTAMPTVTVTPAVADATRCTMSASPASIAIGATSTLTLLARNSSGVALATGGDTVVFTASGGTATGTISATTDHGDGTYTAVYTGTGAGTAQTISATIDGSAVTTTSPRVTVTTAAQAPDPTKCTVTVSAATIAVNGTSTITLQAINSAGANLTTGGAAVQFTASGGTSRGTISSTVDHGDGTYTAVYTATTAGTAQTIGATVNGAAVTTARPTITVTAGSQVVDPTKCTVSVSPPTVTVNGTSVITLQAKNSSGANVTVGGATVVFTASGGTSTGTISATTDHNNGTYTAIYTGTGVGTAQTIGATVNGAAVTTALPTITVSGSFQAPDIINNYGFESGFGPFNNGGGGTPDSVIDATLAYEGTHSLKYAFAPSGSDTGSSTYSEASANYDRLWVRVYFRLTNHVTSTWKFIRFYDNSISTNAGGVWIEKDGGALGGNGLVCVGWDQENGAIITTIGLTEAQVIDGNWHSLEVDFQRNGGASGFPEAAFWFDGNPQYPELNGHSTVQYYGSGNKSTWVNGRVNAGERASSTKIGAIEWMGTLNGGNAASGQCNMDYIGVSSLGRIGP